MRHFFVTGTDTDVGKTYVTAQLLRHGRGRGLSTLGLKPVAAGCDRIQGELCNGDALLLQENSSCALPYAQHNPVALQPPIAPHIAAQQAGVALNLAVLNRWYADVRQTPADLVLVEGAGGWRLPLNQSEYLPQFVQQHALPVILVVGMKLGCLNHSLLTAEAIQADGLPLAGWVANQIDPRMAHYAENLAFLRQHLPAPCLGVVGYGETGEFDLDSLLGQG